MPIKVILKSDKFKLRSHAWNVKHSIPAANGKEVEALFLLKTEDFRKQIWSYIFRFQ